MVYILMSGDFCAVIETSYQRAFYSFQHNSLQVLTFSGIEGNLPGSG